MSRGVKVVLLVLLLFFLLWFVGIGEPIADAGVALLLGWIRFLDRVLPQIRVNPSAVAFFALCLAAAAVVGHRFCRWLRQGEPWHWRWTLAGLAGVVVLFASGMAFTGVAHQAGWLLRSPVPLTMTAGFSNERSASASLKTIAMAQADFRGNDRDGNGVQDYWRADIAGLYLFRTAGEMIRLIEISVAGADGKPTTPVESIAVRSPKAGYWFRALRFKDESAPDPQRFAAIAYPDRPAVGRNFFVVSHDRTIYKKAVADGPAPEVYPEDPLKEGWTKLE